MNKREVEIERDSFVQQRKERNAGNCALPDAQKNEADKLNNLCMCTLYVCIAISLKMALLLTVNTINKFNCQIAKRYSWFFSSIETQISKVISLRNEIL